MKRKAIHKPEKKVKATTPKSGQPPKTIEATAVSLDQVKDWLVEQKLAFEEVLQDCLHVPNYCTPSLATIDAEVKWIPRESIRNRRNQAMSRDKAYYHIPPLHWPTAVPFYGGYPGAIAGHALSIVINSDANPVVSGYVERLRGVEPSLNHVIVTAYRDEKDSIGGHSDKTANLLPNSLIFDISIGTTRRLVFRDSSGPIHTVEMKHGSLFVFGPLTNAAYTHEVPTENDPCGRRISIICRAAATLHSQAQQAAKQRQYAKTLEKHEGNPPVERVIKKPKRAKKTVASSKMQSSTSQTQHSTSN
jgi:hypothetical protein